MVVIRFGSDSDPTCMQMDEALAGIAAAVKNFAVIYVVDTKEVPAFNEMYELYDPCTTMFFFRNKHIMIDLGTGNNNKITWAMTVKQELIDIIETVYRGARKGSGLVISVSHAAPASDGRRGVGGGGVCVGSEIAAPRTAHGRRLSRLDTTTLLAHSLPLIQPRDYSTKYRY